MTFEQFQATRKWSANLADDVGSENWEGCAGTPQGNLYLGCLYIDQVQPWWPEAAQGQGKWHLLLGRDEYISNDLNELELRLYQWAMSEGYASEAETLDDLTSEYAAWNKANGTNFGCALETLQEGGLLPAQRLWLTAFSLRWDSACEREHDIGHAEAVR